MTGHITVFAAASLTAAFTEIGKAFSQAYPEAKATFGFDASSALVQQITQGAPADVFASADTANMDKLTSAGLNGPTPVIFATNLLRSSSAKGTRRASPASPTWPIPDLRSWSVPPQVPVRHLRQADLRPRPTSRSRRSAGAEREGRRHQGDRRARPMPASSTPPTCIAAGTSAGGGHPGGSERGRRVPDRQGEDVQEHADRCGLHRLCARAHGQAILAKYGFLKP